MVGPTVQLIALACHFNARARGISTAEPFFPANNACDFCEYIEFLRPRRRRWFGASEKWTIDAPTPDAWLEKYARPGTSARLLHHPSADPPISDRMAAGFVGGGGEWLLVTASGGRADAWAARWGIGDRNAADRRIWRVDYGLVAEQAAIVMPQLPSLHELKSRLGNALGDVLRFAERHNIEGFANCFRDAGARLSAEPSDESFFGKNFAPPGLLTPEARQMLDACQTAWVFGGMGSWNDMGFDGDEQDTYDRVSDALYSSINQCISAAANSTASDPA
jgi:hypothetical protein